MACRSNVSSPYTTREKTQRGIGEEIYKESETLPLGVLPTKKRHHSMHVISFKT